MDKNLKAKIQKDIKNLYGHILEAEVIDDKYYNLDLWRLIPPQQQIMSMLGDLYEMFNMVGTGPVIKVFGLPFGVSYDSNKKLTKEEYKKFLDLYLSLKNEITKFRDNREYYEDCADRDEMRILKRIDKFLDSLSATLDRLYDSIKEEYTALGYKELDSSNSGTGPAVKANETTLENQYESTTTNIKDTRNTDDLSK